MIASETYLAEALLALLPSFKKMSLVLSDEYLNAIAPPVVEDAPVFSPNSTASVYDITFSNTTPSIYLDVVIDGVAVLPENEWDIPYVNTNVFRKIAIVKDGKLVKDALLFKTYPGDDVDIPSADFVEVRSGEAWVGDEISVDLSRIPLSSFSKEEATSSVFAQDITKHLLQATSDQLNVKAFEKVVKASLPSGDASVNKTAMKYGDDVAEYLESVGITDSGFKPKGAKYDKSEPFCTIKVRGFSNLPSVPSVVKSQTAGKNLTPAQALIAQKLSVDFSHIKTPTDLKNEVAGVKLSLAAGVCDVLVGLRTLGVDIGEQKGAVVVPSLDGMSEAEATITFN